MRPTLTTTMLVLLQMMLMGGTILGPGTIFLMLVGAFVAAFKIDNWTSFYYNIIPIMLFMVICFTCKSNIQVRSLTLSQAQVRRCFSFVIVFYSWELYRQ